MSGAGNEAREWRFYVTDMIEFGEKVRACTAEMDQAAFVADARTRDVVPRNLELIGEAAPHLFADFNGLPGGAARTEYRRHDANWSNRMVLGDTLQVMESLAGRERPRRKPPCPAPPGRKNS